MHMENPTAVPARPQRMSKGVRALIIVVIVLVVLAVIAWFAVPKLIAMREERAAAAQAQYRSNIHAQMEADAAANPVTVTDAQKTAIQQQMTTVSEKVAASAPTDDEKAQIRAQMQQAANAAK